MGYVNIILIIYLCLLKGPIDAKHLVSLVSCNVLTWFKVKKNFKNVQIILRTLYIIVAPLCSAFLKRVNSYKAHRSEKRGVL